MPDHDVVIVGAGVAGLSAALVLGRQRLSVALVSESRRRNSGATEVHMLPHAEGAAPEDLYARIEDEARKCGVQVITARADDVTVDTEAGVVVHTETGQLSARRLLLATGVTDDVPGWMPPESWGSTVFTCPFCHAYEHGGDDFLVVGKGVIALEVGLLCQPHAKSLTVVISDHEADTSPAAQRVREVGGTVVTGTVTSAEQTGGDLLATLSTGDTVRAGAVLVSQLSRSPAPVVGKLDLELASTGLPEADDSGRTSNPVVYLAGNAAKSHLLLAESMADGVRVGMSICKDLLL